MFKIFWIATIIYTIVFSVAARVLQPLQVFLGPALLLQLSCIYHLHFYNEIKQHKRELRPSDLFLLLLVDHTGHNTNLPCKCECLSFET